MRTRNQNAFTLIELLVVIGIITILIGILIPVVTRSRISANRTMALSNLRQIGQAVLMYSGEFKGAYPTDLPEASADDGRSFCALGLLAQRSKLPPAVFINPNTNDSPATRVDAAGQPILLELDDGTAITQTAPTKIDASNIHRVQWHCSFAYDADQKHAGRRFAPRVYLGDRADYGQGKTMSAAFKGQGMCLLFTDQHAEYIQSKAIREQHDPNIYHHNQYLDDKGQYPGEGATEVTGDITTTPMTLDTHLRVFSEEEDDALLPE